MSRGTAHIYGPVLSRRLGTSLGVDLVPYKTCTFDCIYCQLGPTTCLTRDRAIHVPTDGILYEIGKVLDEIPRPDCITLAGSGEPTLHGGIGEVILGIRSLTDIPIAILTNGSLLSDRGVRTECGLADIVLPSLDAGDDLTFRKVNRPLPGMTFGSLVEGLKSFRREFAGQVWLEVMLLRGVNDNEAAVRRIADLAAGMRPDRIHLNTAVRPASDVSVRAVSLPALKRFMAFFTPEASAACWPEPGPSECPLEAESIPETVGRRPCTLGEIARLMKSTPVEVSKMIGGMLHDGRIETVRRAGKVFYTARVRNRPGGVRRKH